MPQIAKVAVEAVPYAVDKPFSYRVPAGMAVSVGCRVLVPFGRGNRTAEAIVLALSDETPQFQLKDVRTVLDGEPLLGEQEIRLALWMRQRYFCTVYEALRVILPAAVWYQYRELWQLSEGAQAPAGERQAALYAALQKGERTAEDLQKDFGPDAEMLLRELEKQGVV